MKQGFSIGMDIVVDEDGQYNASISYLVTDDNDLVASSTGDSLEEACQNVYNELIVFIKRPINVL